MLAHQPLNWQEEIGLNLVGSPKICKELSDLFVFYRRGGEGGVGGGRGGIDFYSLHMCLGLSLSGFEMFTLTRFRKADVTYILDSFYCTLIKVENQIFLIYKEIQSGAVAKSYMRKGYLINEKVRKYFPIHEEAVSYI
jgi:hypothetical protein